MGRTDQALQPEQAALASHLLTFPAPLAKEITWQTALFTSGIFPPKTQ
jgi:hypothetical protein